jgi:hypothetical protein
VRNSRSQLTAHPQILETPQRRDHLLTADYQARVPQTMRRYSFAAVWASRISTTLLAQLSQLAV